MAVTVIKTTISNGGSLTPDASGTVNGKVRLAGALGGTASAPTVFGLASRAELEALILQLAGGVAPTDPVTFMAPGFVAEGYVQ